MVDNAASRHVLEKIGMHYEEDFTFAGLTVAEYVLFVTTIQSTTRGTGWHEEHCQEYNPPQ